MALWLVFQRMKTNPEPSKSVLFATFPIWIETNVLRFSTILSNQLLSAFQTISTLCPLPREATTISGNYAGKVYSKSIYLQCLVAVGFIAFHM